MKCRYCGGRIIYIQNEKRINEKYKAFTIRNDVGEKKEIMDFAECEVCGRTYSFKKEGEKILINTFLETRLKNAIYNFIKDKYGDYSKEILLDFLDQNHINTKEIINYIESDQLLSKQTMEEIISLFSPPQEIASFWRNHYTVTS